MIEGVAGLTFTEAELRDDRRLEAQAMGYKFIELELNPQHVREAQEEVRLTGVEEIDVFNDGRLPSGLPRRRSIIQGGFLKFRLDPNQLKWIAWMVDTEHNRSFLVSHYNDPKEDWAGDKFVIRDPQIKANIEQRYQKKRAEAKTNIIEMLKTNSPESRAKAMLLASRFRYNINNMEQDAVKPHEEMKELKKIKLDDINLEEENQKLKEQLSKLKIKKKPKRRTARRTNRRGRKKEVVNADNQAHGNNVAEGSGRLEPDGGPGDSAGS
jgi:hypothetical protein